MKDEISMLFLLKYMRIYSVYFFHNMQSSLVNNFHTRVTFFLKIASNKTLLFSSKNYYRVSVYTANFNNTSVKYRGGQFYYWRKPEYPEVTDKLII